MSLIQKNPIQCPRCGASSTADVWGSINVETDSHARDFILDGSLFMFQCPACGHETRLIYNTLYLDKERGQMFYLIEGSGEERAAAEAEALAAAETTPFWRDGGFVLRIVHSANDLREKILLFDHGYDDRIVEICKGVALSQLPEDSVVLEIHFAVIAGQRVLALMGEDGEEQYVVDFQSLYDTMFSEYIAAMPPLYGDTFECVDIAYVGALLRKLHEKEEQE